MHTKRRFVAAIVCGVLLVLVVGAVLYQVSPFIRQHLSCPWCTGASDTAAPDLYIMSHRNPGAFVSETFLYTINGRTGSVKQATDLGQMGSTSYQQVLDGISYQLFSNGVGSAPGTNDMLTAVRLSDGKPLWTKTFAPQAHVKAASATTLYVVSPLQAAAILTAISRRDGHTLWAYELQSDPQITLDNDALFVQEAGGTSAPNEQFFALNAENGHILWNHFLNELNMIAPNPVVVDDGHVFFISQPYSYEQAAIVEYDEKTGNLLWQKQFGLGKAITALHSENQALLIETTDVSLATHQTVTYRPIYTLTVLRGTDKSLLWSYTLQPSSATTPDQLQDFQWIYSNDIVYSLSPSTDPQTFAEVLEMSAWRISDGQRLFQAKLDLPGDENLNVIRLSDLLVFTSRNTSLGVPAHNDIEVRQAQTGALLWHKHFGQTEQDDAYGLELYISDITNLNTGLYGDIPDALPLNGESDQANLYLTLLQEPGARTLYALNRQSGALLWKVNPVTLDIDPHLHGLVHTVTLAGARYTITEFPAPDPTSGPLNITSGPDGNLWFTESLFGGASEDGIGRITPGGSITEFPIPGSNFIPGGITSGPDGNVWFTEGISYGGGSPNPALSTGKIGRITPNGNITEFPLPGVGSSPQGITRGSDGSVWFTESQFAAGQQQGGIGRITPGGSITIFPLAENRTPGDITSGLGGTLWFTESIGNGFTNRQSAIGRITTSGKITLFSLPNAEEVRMITLGPDGNVWFTAVVGGHSTIGRITTGGSVALFVISHSFVTSGGGGAPYGIETGPVAIARGLDGDLWFTNLSQSGQIGRITPSGTITTFSLSLTYSYGITVGSDGNVWFTETGPNQIGRIAFDKESL